MFGESGDGPGTSRLIVSLPLRLAPHLVDYGFLVDPATRRPVWTVGRDIYRVTAGFPAGCYALALPGRVAAHVAALPGLLHGAGGPQVALLLQSAWRPCAGGRMAPAHVVAQRIDLDERSISAGRDGDSMRARGLVFDASVYAAGAPAIVADLLALCANDGVSVRLPARERLDIARPALRPAERAARRVRDVALAARRMIAALQDGVRLRLGAGDCDGAEDFLEALADVLALLPERLRCAVTAAVGLGRDDEGVQLAFSTDFAPAAAMSRDPLAGADPDESLDAAGRRLFRAPQDEGPRAGACHQEHGLCLATREDARLGPILRRFLADHAIVVAVEDEGSLAARLQALVAQWPPDAARLARFARDCARADAPPIGARVTPDGSERLAARFVAFLDGDLRERPCLPLLRFALELAAVAPAGSAAARAGQRARRELRALLVATPVLRPDDLAVLASGGALTRDVAAMIAASDEAVMRPVRRSVALAEMMGETARALADRARARLAPTDARRLADWGARGADAADPLDLIAALAASTPGGDATAELRGLVDRLAADRRLPRLAAAARLLREAAARRHGDPAFAGLSALADRCDALAAHAAPPAATVVPLRRAGAAS